MLEYALLLNGGNGWFYRDQAHSCREPRQMPRVDVEHFRATPSFARERAGG